MPPVSVLSNDSQEAPTNQRHWRHEFVTLVSVATFLVLCVVFPVFVFGLWLLTASLLLCAPCLHLLGSGDTLMMTRVAAAGFGLFSGLLMGNIFPAAFEVVPVSTRATAVGVLNLCGGLMAGFATLFGGLWKSSLGIDRLLSLTAAAYLAAGVLLIAGIYVFFPKDFRTTQ